MKLWARGMCVRFGCFAIGWALCVPADAASPSLARQLGREIADTVARVMPSVVVVRTEAMRYLRAYDWFYGRITIPQVLQGQGSGMIIDPQGYVLTSRHVVAGAQEIQVVLDDGTPLRATIVGMDANTDLAVLKVEKPRSLTLRPIEWGDSDALRVGEFVIAIGSPFSLASSVTLGIVSQKGRSVGLLPLEDFIQTDAPINPGNSGGPLVDMDGRVVGVNAVIQTSGAAPGNIGIGFAVPINLARRVAEAIIRTGRFERPWLGISMDELPPSEDPSQPRGVRVVMVYRGTPAARAGLRPDDVIVRVNGQPVNGARDLLRVVMAQPVGATLDLEVRRNGEVRRLSVRTTAMPPISELHEE